MNSQTIYTIDQSRCTFCAGCSAVCPELAIEISDTRSVITASCTGCGLCAQFCPAGAVACLRTAGGENSWPVT